MRARALRCLESERGGNDPRPRQSGGGGLSSLPSRPCANTGCWACAPERRLVMLRTPLHCCRRTPVGNDPPPRPNHAQPRGGPAEHQPRSTPCPTRLGRQEEGFRPGRPKRVGKPEQEAARTVSRLGRRLANQRGHRPEVLVRGPSAARNAPRTDVLRRHGRFVVGAGVGSQPGCLLISYRTVHFDTKSGNVL